MRGEAIARRSASPLAGRAASIAACLPEQLCSSRRRLRPALEVVLRRGRLREQAAHGLELVRPMRDATRRRSRSRHRRDRAAPGRAAAPGSASRSCGSSVTSSGSPRDCDDLPSDTATAWTRCRASTTSPRTTSTTIGSTRRATPNRSRLRMVGISRMFRDHRPITPTTSRRRPRRRGPEAAARARRRVPRADRLAPARAGGEHDRARQPRWRARRGPSGIT